MVGIIASSGGAGDGLVSCNGEGEGRGAPLCLWEWWLGWWERGSGEGGGVVGKVGEGVDSRRLESRALLPAHLRAEAGKGTIIANFDLSPHHPD